MLRVSNMSNVSIKLMSVDVMMMLTYCVQYGITDSVNTGTGNEFLPVQQQAIT